MWTRRDVDDRRGLAAVPRLTEPQRVMLDAILLADGKTLVDGILYGLGRCGGWRRVEAMFGCSSGSSERD